MILVKGRTCPMCQVAENAIKEAGITVEEVYNDEVPELVSELGIMSVPSLVVEETNSVYRGLAEILPFLQNLK